MPEKQSEAIKKEIVYEVSANALSPEKLSAKLDGLIKAAHNEGVDALGTTIRNGPDRMLAALVDAT